MTNSERYRAAFGHLRAPADAAQRALEELDRPQPAPTRRKTRFRPLVAAAILIVVLAGAVGAEASSGEISNLLAPLYGGAQTALVDRIGIPLDASVTSNGYTLTAEAVLGDRYHFMVIYTLTRDDGQPIPEGATVSDWETDHFGSGGGSLEIWREGLPENQLRIVETYGGRAPVVGRYYTVTLRNLVRYHKEDDDCTYDVVAEGEWTLGFALRYQDCTQTVSLKDTQVTGESGSVYTLHKLQISPIGLHVTLTAPTTAMQGTGGVLADDIRPVLRLTDGTLLELWRCGSGGSWASGDETCKAHLEGDFSPPIALEDIAAIRFGDTEFPLDLS